jgi:hypothetical protein
MPCFNPIEGWYAKEVNKTGKRSLVFNPKYALQPDDPIKVPCGQCIGCRLKRSKSWAIRCVHEASCHEKNVFITLTFNDEHLVKRDNPYSLDKTEFPKFMKRLRKHLGGTKVRYFHCGEYGEKYGRPHYHAILFGIDFDDKYLWNIQKNGHRLYRSPTLEKLWPFGYCSIGEVTFESAAYVARYIVKKVTGEMADNHYAVIDDETGEILAQKEPEYTTMSRRPGIGLKWFEQNWETDCKKDYVTSGGRCIPLPKYYDKKIEEADPYFYDELKATRIEKVAKYAHNNTPERLAAREKCQLNKLKHLPRNLD